MTAATVGNCLLRASLAEIVAYELGIAGSSDSESLDALRDRPNLGMNSSVHEMVTTQEP